VKERDVADVMSRVDQLEADALTAATGRESAAFDDRHLMRHVRVDRVVGDAIDARFWDDLTGLEFFGRA